MRDTGSDAFVFHVHRVDSKTGLTGRIEHVLSGKSTAFSGLQELETFARETLEELEITVAAAPAATKSVED